MVTLKTLPGYNQVKSTSSSVANVVRHVETKQNSAATRVRNVQQDSQQSNRVPSNPRPKLEF